MFMQKQFSICLLATLAVQVFYASASPIETTSHDDLYENTAENELNQLEGRGLFDFVPNPMNMMSGGAKAVDDNLRTARAVGTNAVKNTVGTGLQVTTGVNPVALMDMPKNLMKTAVRGAKVGTGAAFDATASTLDTVQNLHDRKKQLLEDYVVPVAPTMVTNAIDRMNDGFDSTMVSIKNGVQNGRARAMETLNGLEERLEKGSPIVPAAITDRLDSAGKFISNNSWFSGLGFGPGVNPSKAAEDVAAEAQAPLKSAGNAVGNAPSKAAEQMAEAAAVPMRAARRLRDARPLRRSSWLG